jgi:hypothetical protein
VPEEAGAIRQLAEKSKYKKYSKSVVGSAVAKLGRDKPWGRAKQKTGSHAGFLYLVREKLNHILHR